MERKKLDIEKDIHREGEKEKKMEGERDNLRDIFTS